MNPISKLYDEGFAHNILLMRNRELLARRVARLINGVEAKHTGPLLAAAALLSGKDLIRLARGKHTGTGALKRLDKRLTGMLDQIQSEMKELLTPELKKLAYQEQCFWVKQLGEVISEIPEIGEAGLTADDAGQRSTESRINKTAVLGLGIAASISGYRQTRKRKIRQAVSAAAGSQGASREVINVFKVSKRDRGRGRIIGGSVASILSWTRTLHTAAAAQGAQAFSEKQGEAGEQTTDLIAINVLDENTSDECWERHGQLVNRDMGGETAPYHINCRTYHVVTILFNGLTAEERGKLSPEVRNALKGGIPDARTSTKAFNRLSAAKQKEILGPTRYKLHKDGKLSYPRDFVDPRSRERWTLDELARREGIEIK